MSNKSTLPPEAKIITKALAQRQANMPIDAIVTLTKGLQEFPDKKGEIFYSILGQGYLELGLMYRALPYYQEAIKNQKNPVDDILNLSSCYMSMKMFHRASQLCESTLKEYPNNYELLFQLGNIYEQSKNLKKALQYFEKSYQLKSDFQRSLLGKIRCLVNLGKFEEAHVSISKLDASVAEQKDQFLDFVNYIKKNFETQEFNSTLNEFLNYQATINNLDYVKMANAWFIKGLNDCKSDRVRTGLVALEFAKLLRQDYYHYELVYNEFIGGYDGKEEYYFRTYMMGKVMDDCDESFLSEIVNYIPVFDPHRFEPTRKRTGRYAMVELEDIHPSLQQHYLKANQLFIDKQFISALVHTDLLLNNEPDLGEALLLKINLLMEFSRFEEAASIIYQYLSLREGEEQPVKLAIEIFSKLGDKDKVEYYKEMLKSVKSSTTVTDEHRSAFFGGMTTTTRSTQQVETRRDFKNLTERYELPRGMWNFLGHCYVNLIRENFNHMMEIMIQQLIHYEPNYAEGRMVHAAYCMNANKLDKAQESIDHVLNLDGTYQHALVKKEELQKLQDGNSVQVSMPPLIHYTFLPTDFYTKLPSFISNGRRQKELKKTSRDVSKSRKKHPAGILGLGTRILSGEHEISVPRVSDNINAAKQQIKKYSGNQEFLLNGLQYLRYELENGNTSPEIYVTIADIMLKLGFSSGTTYSEESRSESWKWVKLARNQNQNDPKVLRHIARLHYFDKDFDRVIPVINRAISNQSDMIENNYNYKIKIEAMIETGVTYSDIKPLIDNIRLPDDGTEEQQFEFHNLLGNLYLRFDPVRSALHYIMAIQKKNDIAWLWHNLSISLKNFQVGRNYALDFALGCSLKAISLMTFEAAQNVKDEIIKELGQKKAKRIGPITQEDADEMFAFVLATYKAYRDKEKELVSQETTSHNEARTTTPKKVKFCTKCGTQRSNMDNKFCTKCGNKY